jgi:hypothetical protein
MGIGVIVDGRSVALAPAQNNQVEFSIALVDQISRVSASRKQTVAISSDRLHNNRGCAARSCTKMQAQGKNIFCARHTQ